MYSLKLFKSNRYKNQKIVYVNHDSLNINVQNNPAVILVYIN